MGMSLVAIGLGPLEIGIILLVVLLIFGPQKLPQLGEGIGKMLRGFKKEMKAIDEDNKERAGQAQQKDRRDEIDVTPKGGPVSDENKA